MAGGLVALGLLIGGCGKKQDPPTLGDFKKCQQSYCQQMLDHLREPIEWHLVLDLSKSYMSAKRLESSLAKARSVLQQLPMAEGDTLCVGAFDVVYRPSFCSDPIDEVEWPFMVSRDGVPMAELTTLLTTSGDREWTDIEASVSGLPTVNERRTYFVMLTDGRHEPLEHRSRRPLFVGDQPEMLKVLRGFPARHCGSPEGRGGHLHRGLLLVIDGAAAEQSDWRRGRRLLARAAKRLPEADAELLPEIVIWSFEDKQPPPIEAVLRRQVERSLGVYPCLDQRDRTAPSGRPRGPGLPIAKSKDCAFWTEGPLELWPTKTMSVDHAEVAMPIGFLVMSPLRQYDLTVSFETEEFAHAIRRAIPETSSPRSSLSSWRLSEVTIPMVVSAGALNGHRLPVKASFLLDDYAPTKSFLELKLPAIHHLWGLGVLARRPGYLLLTSALCLWLLSLGGIAYASRRPPFLRLVPLHPTTEAEDDVDTDPLLFQSNGIRFKVRVEGDCTPTIQNREPRLLTPPKIVDQDDHHVYIDVVHLGFVPYFMVWRGYDFSNPVFEAKSRIGQDVRPLESSDAARGQLMIPRTSWRLKWQSLLSPLVEQEWPCLLRFTHIVARDPISLRAKLSEPRKSFFWRLFSILVTHTLAATCAVVAVSQLFGWTDPTPDSYVRIVLGLWLVLFVVLAGLWCLGRSGGRCATVARYLRRGYSLIFSVALSGGWILLLFPGELVAFTMVMVIALVGVLAPVFLTYWVETRIQENRSFAIPQIVLDAMPLLSPMVGQS